MRELHIIESETPGITKTKFRMGDKKPHFAIGSTFEKTNWSSYKTFIKNKKYENKKIIKIYRSSWNPNEFFIKHFM